MSGVCHEISAGSHPILYGVSACEGQSTFGEAYTGWKSAFYIYAEELRVELVKTCSGNPVNCEGP